MTKYTNKEHIEFAKKMQRPFKIVWPDGAIIFFKAYAEMQKYKLK